MAFGCVSSLSAVELPLIYSTSSPSLSLTLTTPPSRRWHQGRPLKPYTIVSNTFTLHASSSSLFAPVSSRYDFSSSGEGVYSFEPVTDFMILDDDGTLLPASDFVDVQHPPTAQIVTLHGTIATPLNQKRATVACKDPAKASFIDAAYREAKSFARQSSSYIASRGADDDLYKWVYVSRALLRVILTLLQAVLSQRPDERCHQRLRRRGE